MKPKVSIIIPFYNDSIYIEDSVQSIIKQTYHNMEIYIVDDGSTEEDYKNKLEKLKKTYESIIPINVIYQKNNGPASARNRGINACSGEYILCLDADDKIGETYIEKAVKVMENNPLIGIVYCYAELFGERKGAWNLPEYSIGQMLVSNVIFITALFRKSDWKQAGGFDESFKVGIEDHDFWLSILELNKTVYQIPETLFFYRIKNISRDKLFNRDIDIVKTYYCRLQLKHKNLYMRHFDEFSIKIRGKLIEEQWKLKKIKDKLKIEWIMKNFPGIKNILRKMIK